jgi:arginine decarboxylase
MAGHHRRDESRTINREPMWEREMPSKTAQIDQFLLIHSARADNWRELTTLADAWATGHGDRAPWKRRCPRWRRSRNTTPIRERSCWLHYASALPPMTQVARRSWRDASPTGLLTHAYRGRPTEWDVHDEMSPGEVADVMPPATGEFGRRGPYFEALFVNSQPAARWPAFAREIRRLRRPEDAFIYEPIIVGSFEDAACAVLLNPDIISVVLAEGFPYRSRHDAPVLRSVLDPLGETESADMSALRLARTLATCSP